MKAYRCPTTASTEENISQLDVIGCGQIFEAEPDAHGIVECPHCGMSFNVKNEPETEQEG